MLCSFIINYRCGTKPNVILFRVRLSGDTLVLGICWSWEHCPSPGVLLNFDWRCYWLVFTCGGDFQLARFRVFGVLYSWIPWTPNQCSVVSDGPPDLQRRDTNTCYYFMLVFWVRKKDDEAWSELPVWGSCAFDTGLPWVVNVCQGCSIQ
jgi:hypothetical protein